jgi:hypothetical protein
MSGYLDGNMIKCPICGGSNMHLISVKSMYTDSGDAYINDTYITMSFSCEYCTGNNKKEDPDAFELTIETHEGSACLLWCIDKTKFSDGWYDAMSCKGHCSKCDNKLCKEVD